jgi:hypothetical protein
MTAEEPGGGDVVGVVLEVGLVIRLVGHRGRGQEEAPNGKEPHAGADPPAQRRRKTNGVIAHLSGHGCYHLLFIGHIV